ncbi:TauD/TfdA family dioxygenase [Sneathiella marina]|uniref:TauD/TfdA family dioxygenase n=1 Tax=Sneathiella marina TaxID=2950108 RepID=A0ABY4W5V9_9PROT|nr:TauD/TfdA family dioxygenase [Sneathiella marina]USG62585.1 TauD/TfdA family dioxygenase [Sneathiella marina]
MVRLQKLTGFMGAEIEGADLRQPISAKLHTFLHLALRDHQVVILRDQTLNCDQHKHFTEVFGPLMKLPYVEPLDEDEYIIAVLKEAEEQGTGVFGGEWHSDFSFLENPPAGSVLYAHDVPDVGGDTVWANQVAAYASLPPDLKEFVTGRQAIHVGAPYGVLHAPPEEAQANTSIRMVRNDPSADRETRHPAVLTDPDTDRKSLFLNPIYTKRFEDLSASDSQPILQEIYRHATRPDFSYRHHWRVGDVVIWNNRTCLHYATNDYDGNRRLLHRTTFTGPSPI